MLISQQIKSLEGKKIPTNIITGFLGVGKTTSIRHLLANKPQNERWSVLVNEFGEIGIDGALLQDTNAQIKEVPGGCICCVADLPMKMALNMMIAKTQPDRILIEPTGLGHPADIIGSLAGDNYSSLLDLRATITLVDPRKLQDARYTEHEVFQDQIAVADVLIANKSDLLSESDRQAFLQLVQSANPAKQAWDFVSQGKIDCSLLDIARKPFSALHPEHHKNKLAKQDAYNPKIQLPDGEDFIRRESSNLEFSSCGWLFKADFVFDFNAVFGWMAGLNLLRAKAVMNTNQGIYMFNADNGVLSVNPAMIDKEDLTDSRLELINDQPMPVADYERELLDCVLTPP